MNEIVVYVLLILLGALGVTAFLFIRHFLEKKVLLKALKMRLLLVTIPQHNAKDDAKQEDFKTEINKTEQLFNVLSNLDTPSVLEVAVHHSGEEIHFYVAVAEESVDYAVRQIHGLWSDAHIENAHDYNIFNPEGEYAAAYIKTEDSFMLPLRTYQEIESDTFEGVLSNLSKLEHVGEGAAIQVIIKRAPKSLQQRIQQAVHGLKKGKKLREVTYTGAWDIVKHALSPGELVSAASGGKSKQDNKSKRPDPVDDASVKMLEQKMSKPLFRANVRLVTSASSKARARTLLKNMADSLIQFNAPARNNLKIVQPKKLNKFVFEYSFREFNKKQSVVLNSEELAGFYHFPGTSTNVPRIKWLKTKQAPPPNNLPHEGVMLGEAIYRGDRMPVRIQREDRRRHLYTVGQTGTGKSNFLTYMAQQDVVNGEGVCVIDPHGDLVSDILGLIPPERADDVIVFDPGDIKRPIALNMLEYDPERPEEKTFIVNEMQAIFNRLFPPETMGPMFEQYMRNALLLLMEDRENPGTLMEVPRVFTDAAWRREKVTRISNPAVVDFWQKEAAKTTGEHSIANMAPYITSKFNNFIANDYIRPIIAQKKSAFRFRKAMDEGKIILVNLSKGKIGELNAGLLGMVIVGKLLMAALSRVDVSQEDRRDFYLYIDEFQNFTTDSIATILSEARKYRLNLTLAHQFIGQLTDEIRDSVFGNVGSMASFRVGAQDAEFLQKQFEPVFNQNDLINIDNFNAYVKVLINNETSRAFNIKTLKAPEGDPEAAKNMRDLSRLKYGQPREEIEADIRKRLKEL